MGFYELLFLLIKPITLGLILWLLYRGVKALETIAAKMKDHRLD